MGSRGILAVLALVSLGLSSVAALDLATPPAGSAARETPAAGVTATVTALAMGYGPEAWKDESATLGSLAGQSPVPLPGLPALPVGGTGVYANPYASPTVRHGSPIPVGPTNWWGYNLTATIEVTDDAGEPVQGDYALAARLAGAPAKLRKDSPTSFFAQIDLDGENGRADVPFVAPGTHDLEIDVLQGGAVVASALVPITIVPATFDRATFPFPDANLPGFNDAAAGNVTPFLPTLVEREGAFTGFATLGRANATAEVLAVAGRAATRIASGMTGPNGRIGFSFEPSTVLGSAATGLVILEAHLVGEGATGASAVLALPVSDQPAKVSGVRLEPAGPAAPLTTLAVTASDEGAGARRGAVLLTKGTQVLATGEFLPSSFLQGTEREARIRVDDLRKYQGLTSYGVIALLLTENGGFYSFATASRGLAVSATELEISPREQAALLVTVRSLTDNFDTEDDPGLELTVDVRITGLPAGGSAEQQLTLGESEEGVFEVPIPAGARREGMYAATIVAIADELAFFHNASIEVRDEPSAIQKVLSEIPQPGALAALVGVGIAALALGRGRRRA